jgi:hypothetical protein
MSSQGVPALLGLLSLAALGFASRRLPKPPRSSRWGRSGAGRRGVPARSELTDPDAAARVGLTLSQIQFRTPQRPGTPQPTAD